MQQLFAWNARSIHVLRSFRSFDTFLLLRVFGLKHFKRTDKFLSNAHQCTIIVEFTTVVRCREDCHQLPLSKELVAVFDYLVCSADQVKVVLFQKLADHIIAEQVAHSPFAFSPALHILGRIRPQ